MNPRILCRAILSACLAAFVAQTASVQLTFTLANNPANTPWVTNGDNASLDDPDGGASRVTSLVAHVAQRALSLR